MMSNTIAAGLGCGGAPIVIDDTSAAGGGASGAEALDADTVLVDRDEQGTQLDEVPDQEQAEQAQWKAEDQLEHEAKHTIVRRVLQAEDQEVGSQEGEAAADEGEQAGGDARGEGSAVGLDRAAEAGGRVLLILISCCMAQVYAIRRDRAMAAALSTPGG